MKLCRVNTFSRVLSILAFCFINANVFAQPGNPGIDPDIPIDGGVSVLIAAGALFGMKKLYDGHRKK